MLKYNIRIYAYNRFTDVNIQMRIWSEQIEIFKLNFLLIFITLFSWYNCNFDFSFYLIVSSELLVLNLILIKKSLKMCSTPSPPL